MRVHIVPLESRTVLAAGGRGPASLFLAEDARAFRPVEPVGRSGFGHRQRHRRAGIIVALGRLVRVGPQQIRYDRPWTRDDVAFSLALTEPGEDIVLGRTDRFLRKRNAEDGVTVRTSCPMTGGRGGHLVLLVTFGATGSDGSHRRHGTLRYFLIPPTPVRTQAACEKRPTELNRPGRHASVELISIHRQNARHCTMRISSVLPPAAPLRR